MKNGEYLNGLFMKDGDGWWIRDSDGGYHQPIWQSNFVGGVLIVIIIILSILKFIWVQ